MCDTYPPQKKSCDVVNGLAFLVTSDDLCQNKGMATLVPDHDLIQGIFSLHKNKARVGVLYPVYRPGLEGLSHVISMGDV